MSVAVLLTFGDAFIHPGDSVLSLWLLWKYVLPYAVGVALVVCLFVRMRSNQRLERP